MKSTGIQKITYYVRSYSYQKKDRLAGLYLGVTIERKTLKIPLEIYFYEKLFDSKTEQYRYNGVNDAEIRDLNLIINKEKGKANEILRQYRLSNQKVTHHQFKRDFLNYASRENFIAWAKAYLEDLRISGVIKDQTYKNKKNRLSHFEAFVKTDVLFAELSPRLIDQFDLWLKKKSSLNKHNSIQSVHVGINTFLKAAQDEGINFDNPYQKFKIKAYQPANRLSLEKSELQELKKLYTAKNLPEMQHEVLRKFLFSCYTGLRISDSANLKYENICDGVLTMGTVKGKKFGKTVKIALPDFAKELAGYESWGFVFNKISDQEVNRTLKEIAAEAKINKNLTFHVARDTFATLFIELGGDVASLKDLLAHTKLETTMIYVKMSEKRKEKLMQNFNSI